MSYCVNCGVELSDGAASCPLCGTPAWKPEMCIRDSCNGFQALIKLGLVPYGKIMDTDADCPTLTYNCLLYTSRCV